MALRTAAQAVEAAKSVLGCKYWYACSGEAPTAAWLNYKIGQYPNMWTPARIAKARGEVGKGPHVFDCIGLMRWICGMEKNRDALNTNADGLLAKCKTKGPIKTLPEVPGVMVFMKGHVGVYIGNGRVIEAHGFKQVDNNPLSFQKWTHWGYCPWLEYPSAAATGEPPQGAAEAVYAPSLDDLRVKPGDKVRIKPGAANYWPGGPALPAAKWLREGVLTVGEISYKGQVVIKGGAPCVLILESGTWTATQNLEKI